MQMHLKEVSQIQLPSDLEAHLQVGGGISPQLLKLLAEPLPQSVDELDPVDCLSGA